MRATRSRPACAPWASARGDVVAVSRTAARRSPARCSQRGRPAPLRGPDPAHPAARLAAPELARPKARLQVEGAGPVPSALVALVEPWVGERILPVARAASSAGESCAARLNVLGPDDVATLAFTSGTSGPPRGIVGTHAPLAHFLDWHARAFDLGPEERFSVLSGLAHDPLLRDVFAPLWVGASAHFPGADDLETPGGLALWMRASGSPSRTARIGSGGL